ncbi:hypothetical protein [Candidatus Neomicrothrix sp.]|uniref:hypothetical protein n=1 Tax=Candidatus Neomicrothrix sp. TaxID=2719034 RepID=UPI002B959FF2|nr:hypothetical protein [Candidatus Microthrix sp.]HMT26348.1 hypothetical protein [Microthrixaceae bacterium]HMT62508.1 hypothetical protein [Microthrixaceae bacterium]
MTSDNAETPDKDSGQRPDSSPADEASEFDPAETPPPAAGTGTILIVAEADHSSDGDTDPEGATAEVSGRSPAGTILLEPGVVRRPEDASEAPAGPSALAGGAATEADTPVETEPSVIPTSADNDLGSGVLHSSLPPAAVPHEWMVSPGATDSLRHSSMPPAAGTSSASQPGATSLGGMTPPSRACGGTPAWAQQVEAVPSVASAKERRSPVIFITLGVLGVAVIGLIVALLLVQSEKKADEKAAANAAVVDFETGAGIVIDAIDDANEAVTAGMAAIGQGADIDSSGVVTAIDTAIDDLEHLAIPDADVGRQADQQALVNAVDAEVIFLKALKDLALVPLIDVQAGAAQPAAESWSQVARALEEAIPVVAGRRPSDATQGMAQNVASFGEALEAGGQQLRENALLRQALSGYRTQVTTVIARYRRLQDELADREMRLWNPETRFDDPFQIFQNAVDARRIVAADLDSIEAPNGMGPTQARMAQIVREITTIVETDALSGLYLVYEGGGTLGDTDGYKAFVRRTNALGDEFNNLEKQILREIESADAALS